MVRFKHGRSGVTVSTKKLSGGSARLDSDMPEVVLPVSFPRAAVAGQRPRVNARPTVQAVRHQGGSRMEGPDRLRRPGRRLLSRPNKTFAASGGNCAITIARRAASSAAVSCAEAFPRPKQAKSVNTPHRQRLLITASNLNLPLLVGEAYEIRKESWPR
jgi:hypothetical protein